MKFLIYFFILLLALVKSIGATEENEIKIIMFYSLGSCQKCAMPQIGVINCIMDKEFENKEEIEVIAAIACRRTRELKLFVKEYNWQYKTIRDSDYFRKKNNINKNTVLALFVGRNKYEYAEADLYERDVCKDILTTKIKEKSKN